VVVVMLVRVIVRVMGSCQVVGMGHVGLC
jgi:hypothetical protein